ncbi:MAG: response regulator [Candidatus Omnitrophota bacterium]|jgi:DNA-binding response OmpR family regulator
MANKKLLVVDDERDFVDIIAERLGAKGFTILKAYDGREGLEKALLEKPDLIVLDIAMPEMNGYDVCIKLKENKDLKDTPVIILTAKFQPNDIEFGREVGADAYLTKPLELDTLLNKVNELLKAKNK